MGDVLALRPGDEGAPNGHILDRSVLWSPSSDLIGRGVRDGVHVVDSAHHSTDGGVLAVEVAVIRLQDEELAAVRVGSASTGERDDSSHEGSGAELVGEGLGRRSRVHRSWDRGHANWGRRPGS